VVEDTSIGGPFRAFPETQWSRILAAREETGPRRALLEDLLAAYWKPLYGHARRKGLTIEAAKDAVQGLFARLLEHDFLAQLDPAKGRLRSYLRGALDHHLASLHEQRVALKRGGGKRLLSLDADLVDGAVAAAPPDPEAAFEREWAQAVVERATAALRREFEAGRRRAPFDVVLRFFGTETPPSYAEAAAACGKTVPQFKTFLHRTRERFRRLVRDEVARTVAVPEDVEAELDLLLRALAS